MARTKRSTQETSKKVNTPVFTGTAKISPVRVMGPSGRKTMMYGVVNDIKPPKPNNFQPELQEVIDEAIKFFKEQQQVQDKIISGDLTSKAIAKQTIAFLEDAKNRAQRMIDKAVQEFSQTA